MNYTVLAEYLFVKVLNILQKRKLYWCRVGNIGDKVFESFDAFYGHSESLQSVLAPEGRKLYSPAAEFIKLHADRDDTPFKSIIEAELLVLLMTCITPDARWYDPCIIQFSSPDTLVPEPYNVLDWNRFAYARYNPLKYTDPSGHEVCENVDDSGICTNKTGRLLDYVHEEIINDRGNIKKKHEGDILGTMLSVVDRAADIFGNDWNGFFDVTDYVFLGYFGHGAGTMWKAHRSEFKGYFDGVAVGDTGFHRDFRDRSNQVRHFWVALASAADPYGDNPLGAIIAYAGNEWHDGIWDTPFRDDGISVIDYKLSVVGIDIAGQIGNEIRMPSDLVDVLQYRLGPNGPGGPYIDPSLWYTPWN